MGKVKSYKRTYAHTKDEALKKRERKPLPKFDELFFDKNNSEQKSSDYFFEKKAPKSLHSSSCINSTPKEDSLDSFDKLLKNDNHDVKVIPQEHSRMKTLSSDSISAASSSNSFLFASPKQTHRKTGKWMCSPDLFEDSPELKWKPFQKEQNIKKGKDKQLSVPHEYQNALQSNLKEPTDIFLFTSPKPLAPPKILLSENGPNSYQGTSNNMTGIVTSTPAQQKNNPVRAIKEITDGFSPVYCSESRTVFEHSSLIESFKNEVNLKNEDSFKKQTGSFNHNDQIGYRNLEGKTYPNSDTCRSDCCTHDKLSLANYQSYSELPNSDRNLNSIHKENIENRVTRRRRLKRKTATRPSEVDFKIPICSYNDYAYFSSNAPKNSFKHSRDSIGQSHQSAISSLANFSLSNVARPSNSLSYLKAGKSWRRSLKNFQALSGASYKVDNEASSAIYKSHIEVSIIDSPSQRPLLIGVEEARNLVLEFCNQEDVLPFSTYFTDEILSQCKKIGEGVYGEVFMFSAQRNEPSYVSKLMPIEGHLIVNGEPQKTFKDIYSEIAISHELSQLSDLRRENYCPSFVQFNQAKCLKGVYSPELLCLWDEFDKNKASENDRPDKFPPTQLYILLEFENAGKDLESFVFTNAMQSHDLFMQIAYGLAVAEKQLEFEHRDLHWGNVLVSHTSLPFLKYKIDSKTYKLPTKGVKAKIIDFTLSRLRNERNIFFYNLEEDPSIFTSEGDIQFEVYRQMRKLNGGNWMKFTPKTNILWLQYLLEKISSECYYKNVKTKIHHRGLLELKSLSTNIPNYESAFSFVTERKKSALKI